MPDSRRRWFFLGFALVSLLLAGVVSAFADGSPDGLESVTARGCTVVSTEGGEQLRGSCPAQEAQDHALAGSPLADYTVGGDESMTGVAGVLGVAATLLVTVGVCLLLRRRGPER